VRLNVWQWSKQMDVEAGILDKQRAERAARIPERPHEAPPHRTASSEDRAAWSERYVAWFISQTPGGPLPPDISPTHRYEVEFAYCMLDPQRYQRETQQELARQPMFH
jgi:hypothetical protein